MIEVLTFYNQVTVPNLTLDWMNWLLGIVVLPLVTSIINKPSFERWVKLAVLIVLALCTALVKTGIEQKLNLENVTSSFSTLVMVSITAYNLMLKDPLEWVEARVGWAFSTSMLSVTLGIAEVI